MQAGVNRLRHLVAIEDLDCNLQRESQAAWKHNERLEQAFWEDEDVMNADDKVTAGTDDMKVLAARDVYVNTNESQPSRQPTPQPQPLPQPTPQPEKPSMPLWQKLLAGAALTTALLGGGAGLATLVGGDKPPETEVRPDYVSGLEIEVTP